MSNRSRWLITVAIGRWLALATSSLSALSKPFCQQDWSSGGLEFRGVPDTHFAVATDSAIKGVANCKPTIKICNVRHRELKVGGIW